MKFNDVKTPHQLRTVLTRETLSVDTLCSIFPSDVLELLLDSATKLSYVLDAEMLLVESDYVKGLMTEDKETLVKNIGVVASAIRLSEYEFYLN